MFTEDSTVTFKKLDSSKIRRYLNSINPLDKAGSYAIQENGQDIVETVAGSYSNVVGLPLEKLSRELQSWAGLPALLPPASAMYGSKPNGFAMTHAYAR